MFHPENKKYYMVRTCNRKAEQLAKQYCHLDSKLLMQPRNRVHCTGLCKGKSSFVVASLRIAELARQPELQASELMTASHGQLLLRALGWQDWRLENATEHAKSEAREGKSTFLEH